MPLVKLVGFIYGALLIAGGFIGLKAGSKVSLVMGILSGLLALAAGFLADTNRALATWMLIGVSAVLAVVFFLRLQETGKLMPSGMLLGLSLLVLIAALTQLSK